MESVECSGCHQIFGDQILLQLHHEYEPCTASNSTFLTNEYLCPICNKSFADPLILEIHVNEDHDALPSKTSTASDNLYAQELARREQMKTQYEHQKQSASTIVDEDFVEDEDTMIARLLQDEEDAQAFAQIQNRYGGGAQTVRERAERNLQNLRKKKLISQAKYDEYKRDLDVIIAQPTERCESRTLGLILLISRLPMFNLSDRRLCKPDCDHISATWLDQGWACGYKNFQMLLSSLRHDPRFSTQLFGSETFTHDVPSVNQLQKLIEKAWSSGFDSEGREQFNGSLVNSTKWIGPTEIMACLSFLNIKTELYEFRQPQNIEKHNAYSFLFKWIQRYFQQTGTNIIHPLYLQHDGHSRTVVGYEQFHNTNIRLLIFDPSTPKSAIENFIKNTNNKAHLFRRSLQSFQKPVYQILVIRGLLDPNEREAAKRIQSIRVPHTTN